MLIWDGGALVAYDELPVVGCQFATDDGRWRVSRCVADGIAEQVADKCLYSVGVERYIVVFRVGMLFDIFMLEMFGNDI